MKKIYSLEEIALKVRANASKKSKIDWLQKEAGFSERQAEEIYSNIMRVYPIVRTASTPKNLKYTVGVEIETSYLDRLNVARELRERGLNVTGGEGYLPYNHEDSETNYKFVSDGSLTGQQPCEVVSPILKNLKSLKTLCDVINARGAQVNSSCGLHVHVGAANFSYDDWRNIILNYYHLQAAINSFMPRSRRGSHWCRPIDDNIANEIQNQTNCHSVGAIQSAFGCDRYFVVNVMAYSRHRTIEFRQHGGTTDFLKIKNWINFLIALIDYSRAGNRLEGDIIEIDDIPFINNAQKAYFKARREEIAARA